MDATTGKVLIRDNAPRTGYAVLFFSGMSLQAFHLVSWGTGLGIVLALASPHVWNRVLEKWWPWDGCQEAKTASQHIVAVRALALAAWGPVAATAWTGLYAMQRHLDGRGDWAECWSWPWFFLVTGVGIVCAILLWADGTVRIRKRRRGHRPEPPRRGNNPRHSSV